MADPVRKVLPGGLEIKAIFLGQSDQDGVGKASFIHAGLPAQDSNGSVIDRQPLVRNDQAGIELHAVAQAGAVGAGAERIVKGKAAGFDLGNADPAVRAGEALGELQELSSDDIGLDQTVGESQGILHGVGHAALRAGADDQTVYDDLDIMLDVFVEGDVLGDIVQVTVDPDADIAGAAGAVDDLLVAALTAADDRGQDLDAGALRQSHHLVHHLVHRLFRDLPAAVGTMGDTDPGIEQTEIVVDLGHGAHGRPGVAVGRLLVDGDGGGESLDVLHIRLFHLAKELARVRGQRLHIAPLSFCVDRIKSKGGFTRS